MAEDVLTPFFERLLSLKEPLPYLESFKQGGPTIEIYAFSSKDAAPTRFTLKPYPFFTIADLKSMIYQHYKRESSAHPMFQSLLLPLGGDPSSLADVYRTFDYTYVEPESSESNGAIKVSDPLDRASGLEVDPQFVTGDSPHILDLVDRFRMTLEDFSSEPTWVLHLFLFKDVLSLLRPEFRASEREWAGRIKPYFPNVELNSTGAVPKDLDAAFQSQLADFTTRERLLTELDKRLESVRSTLLPIQVSGCKRLRLVWGQLPKKARVPLDTLFYKADTTAVRPFLRILPVGAPPITKLKLRDGLKIPEIPDPKLLLQWKEERNPKPDEEFLFGKLMIREGVGKGIAAQPALYGTLRMYPDSSADFTILPPKQLRQYDPRSDLRAIGPLVEAGLQGLPLKGVRPQLGSADLVCSLRIPMGIRRVTSKDLGKRLALFKSVFQQIPPLKGESPLVTVRYIAVSNYAREDRIQTFLHTLTTRRLLKGDAAGPELIAALEDEFEMSKEEATKRVADWIRSQTQMQVAIPETKKVLPTYASGVDVTISADQTYYRVSLSNLDSLRSFQRISTAASLLLTASDKELAITKEIQTLAKEVERASLRAATTIPGADPAFVAQTQGPPPVVTAEEEEEEGLEGVDDALLQLMMGAPAEAEAEAEGEEEEFETLEGNVFGEAVVAENFNVAERAAEAERANAAALARAENVPPPLPRPVAADNTNEEPTSTKKSYQGWVKGKLQEADNRLFQYKTDIAGRKIKKYVTMCQATESRQPFVLDDEQFQTMKQTYADDDEVVFVVYGPDEPEVKTEPGDEVYTLLKYGTDPTRLNYYLCCQFFCTKNYILVREKDFYATVDREGNPKPKGSCPFCKGLEIQVLKSPKPNETVIQRRTKKGDVKRHLYISFLKGETQHPEGFYLPCCFTEDTPIYGRDPRFEILRTKKEAKEEDEEEAQSLSGVPGTSYFLTLHRAHKKYIVGPEKEFLKISELDGPQVGLLPPVLDRYFGQTPKDFVGREGNKMELLPTASCFLRLGVENRIQYRYESFFSALAPYLGYRNTATQVKERIREIVTPLLFTSLNYGNLVLEFYKQEDPNPTGEELKLWTKENLKIQMKRTGIQELAALRIYKSYHAFLDFLDSEDLKQYRQFAQLLSYPNLLTPRGLILIILDLNDKNELSIRCPPFGYNEDRYASADIGFILHRSSGIWEPIFYTENRPASSLHPPKHEPTLKFEADVEEGWPPIVRQRVAEFRRQCRSIGRGAFPTTRDLNPMALVPISKVVKAAGMDLPLPDGVVRDSYNHVVALTYSLKPGSVALPVIDDEYNVSSYKLHFEMDGFKPAAIDRLIAFYDSVFQDLFSLYPGYRIVRCAKDRDDNWAVKLANGLYIPAGPPEGSLPELCKQYDRPEHFEWEINREIYWKLSEVPGEAPLLTTNESELEELYQHLRLTFSQWYGGEGEGGESLDARKAWKEFRELVKTIIDDKTLPLYKRRKRLEVLLGSKILSWMDDQERDDIPESTLMRVDCRLKTEPTCSGKCVWRKGGPTEVGACYLHTPKEYTVGGRQVNGKQLLMYRLLEELLRFPERRAQLLSKAVTKLVKIDDVKQIGNQYILPEGSLAWHDLLRLEWMEANQEMKKYFEEMSSSSGLPSAVPLGSKDELFGKPIPDAVRELFGEEDLSLSLIGPARGTSLAPLLLPLEVTLGDLDVEYDSPTLEAKDLEALVRIIQRPVLYYDFRTPDAPQTLAYKPEGRMRKRSPFVFVLLKEGPRVASASADVYEDLSEASLPIGLLSDLETAKSVRIPSKKPSKN